MRKIKNLKYRKFQNRESGGEMEKSKNHKSKKLKNRKIEEHKHAKSRKLGN